MVQPKGEIENILGEEDWSSEPVMRPEDEIMLKKLHDMLQSTAEELRDLSSEILRSRQPTVQVLTRPTPLDEQFNEKVHTKELVEAKFLGRLLIDKNNAPVTHVLNNNRPRKVTNQEKKVNAGIQVNLSLNKPKNTDDLQKDVSETAEQKLATHNPFYEQAIAENTSRRPPRVMLSCEEYKSNIIQNNESAISQKYVIQEMPRIQIRSELKEQKVVSLSILPDDVKNKPFVLSTNSAIIEVIHDDIKLSDTKDKREPRPEPMITRKVAKIPCDESSESIIKSYSETEINPPQKNVGLPTRPFKNYNVRPHRRIVSIQKEKENVKTLLNKKSSVSHRVSEEWKKKLNVIYGKNSIPKPQRSTTRSKPQQNKIKAQSNCKYEPYECSKQTNLFNNAEYVPYSKLTLGGVDVSDIENELANVRNKADLPLSPILDKILNSHDSSLQDSPRRGNIVKDPGPFSKSDENLLKEVLDIDKKIKKTINKNFLKKAKPSIPEAKKSKSKTYIGDAEESYADDFDEDIDKSDKSIVISARSQSTFDNHESIDTEDHENLANKDGKTEQGMSNERCSSDSSVDKNDPFNNNKTHIKGSNLSLKNDVDIFEFIHAVETQDNATQSNKTQKISLKETQTSPRNDANVQPIHNELWNQASLDTSGEIDKMFKLEKDLIKKLIREEYGDIFELKKNITKPAMENSHTESNSKNISALPKDTQTSPSRVKSVMTSPMKTVCSYHIAKTLSSQQEASPLVLANQEQSPPGTLESDLDEAGITINLSSPRFNLRLPQSSRDVMSNLNPRSTTPKFLSSKTRSLLRQNKDTQTLIERKTSSSESWNDETESDVSSLGEINWRLEKARLRRGMARLLTASESSSASAAPLSTDGCSENLVPGKSEGEISVGQL